MKSGMNNLIQLKSLDKLKKDSNDTQIKYIE